MFARERFPGRCVLGGLTILLGVGVLSVVALPARAAEEECDVYAFEAQSDLLGEKVALYCIMPDEDETLQNFVALFGEPAGEQAKEVFRKAEKLRGDARAEAIKLAAPMQEWIEQQDMALVLSRDLVRTLLHELEEKMAEAEAAIQRDLTKTNRPPHMKVDPAEMMEIYFEIGEELIEVGKEEVEKVALGVRFEPAGLCVSYRACYVDDGELAEIFEGIPKGLGETCPLKQLPEGDFVFLLAMRTPESLGPAMLELTEEFMDVFSDMYGVDGDDFSETMEKSMDLMKQLGSMAYLMEVPEEDEPLYSGLFGMMQVEDADSYMEENDKLTREFFEKAEPESLFGGMTIEKTEIGGQQASKMTFPLDFIFQGQEIPEEQRVAIGKLFEAFYGSPDSLSVYFGKASLETLGFGYVSPKRIEALQEFLKSDDSTRKSMAQKESVRRTMAMLPEDAQMVILIDPNQGVKLIRAAMSVIVPKAMTGIVPSMPEGPPVGFSVQVGQGQVRKDLFVPTSLLKKIEQFFSRQKTESKEVSSEELIEQEEQ